MSVDERELATERIFAGSDRRHFAIRTPDLDLEPTGFADDLVFARRQALAGFHDLIEQIIPSALERSEVDVPRGRGEGQPL